MRTATRVALLAILAISSACTEARGQAFLPIRQQEVKYYVGDSITEGSANAGGSPYFTQFEADTGGHVSPVVKAKTPVGLGATSTKPTSGATMTAASLGGVAYHSTYSHHGYPSYYIALIRGAESEWLTEAVSLNATIVIIEAGVNNVSAVPNQVAEAQADALALIADIHAALPNARVSWVNIFASNEQYPAPTDADVLTVNGYIAAAVSANSSFAYLFDVRTGQQAYEAVNNVPSPGVACCRLTLDGTHLSTLGLANVTTSMEAQILYQ